MLRNREETEETKLKGVDLVSEDADVKFGSFVLLQNYIPTEIFSLQKKRGVVVLSTTPITPTIPGFELHPFLFYISSAFGEATSNRQFFRITSINTDGEIGHPFLFMGA
jgi:hypothetical protein